MGKIREPSVEESLLGRLFIEDGLTFLLKEDSARLRLEGG